MIEKYLIYQKAMKSSKKVIFDENIHYLHMVLMRMKVYQSIIQTPMSI